MKWQFHDGGRKLAGYRPHARDCVIRSISIALNLDYKRTAKRIAKGLNWDDAHWSQGMHSGKYRNFLFKKGWMYISLTGERCDTDNAEDRLPKTQLILQMHRHLVACYKHILYDTWDSRTIRGKKKYPNTILGYWQKI